MVGKASSKSQKTVKDSELETEFLIINKREDRTLYMEGLGCRQPAWGTQEATHPQPSALLRLQLGGAWALSRVFWSALIQ